MPGKIKTICDKIIQDRAKGNPAMEKITKTKLALKGINPDKFTAASPDDEEIIKNLTQIAKELGVSL